jgi:hypothetical protein
MRGDPLPVALPDRSAPALHGFLPTESMAATIAALSLMSNFEPVQLSGRMSRDILQALADFLKFRLSPLQVTADVSDQVRFVRRQNQVSVAEREGVHVAFLAPLVARCRRCHSDDRFGFRTGPGE